MLHRATRVRRVYIPRTITCRQAPSTLLTQRTTCFKYARFPEYYHHNSAHLFMVWARMLDTQRPSEAHILQISGDDAHIYICHGSEPRIVAKKWQNGRWFVLKQAIHPFAAWNKYTLGHHPTPPRTALSPEINYVTTTTQYCCTRENLHVTQTHSASRL